MEWIKIRKSSEFSAFFTDKTIWKIFSRKFSSKSATACLFLPKLPLRYDDTYCSVKKLTFMRDFVREYHISSYVNIEKRLFCNISIFSIYLRCNCQYCYGFTLHATRRCNIFEAVGWINKQRYCCICMLVLMYSEIALSYQTVQCILQCSSGFIIYI